MACAGSTDAIEISKYFITDDFNAIRTLVELVDWCFHQLDSDAAGDSRMTMRQFIHACVLLAASDGPQQLLQGQLQSLPTRFRPGELLRLNLNREPATGNAAIAG